VTYLHTYLRDASQVTISFSRACSGSERNLHGHSSGGGGGLVGYSVVLVRGPCEPQVDSPEENQRQEVVQAIRGEEAGETGEGSGQAKVGDAESIAEIVKIGGVKVELNVVPTEGSIGKAGDGDMGGVGDVSQTNLETDVSSKDEVGAGEGCDGSRARKESSI